MKQRAKNKKGTLRQTLERWWCTKYHQPPNSPLFTSSTIPELLCGYYEDLEDKRSELEEKLKHQLDVRERVHVMENLSALKKILDGAGEKAVDDPLARFWEEQVERGEEPSLDLTIEDLQDMGYA